MKKDAQVNFTAPSAATSLGEAYSFTTSSPTPFWRSSDPASADTGTYQLFKGLLVMKRNGDVNLVDWQVDIVSDSRFTLYKPIVNGNQPNYVVCDSAEAVPASPTSPTATNNKTGINLAWTDSSSDETGFKIYRKLSTETEAKVIATQTGVTYSDTDLTEGQTAYYQVVAYNDNGESAKSKAVSATLDNIAPTVVSTTPENNGTGSRQLRNVVVTFSEKVETVCPAGDQSTGLAGSICPTSGSPVTFTAMIGGESRVVSSYSLTAGFGGSTTVSLTTMGSAERFDANQTGITVTVDKDWIRDANGVQMTEDFQFNFNVDASLDNPSCPPSC